MDQKIKKATDRNRSSGRGRNRKQVYESYHGSRGMPAGYQKTFEVCGCISGGSNKNGGTTRISANGMPEQHDRESQGDVVVSGS